MQKHIPLGKETHYCFAYDADLLFPIAREPAGNALSRAFFGEDIWTAYELSWLNAQGVPEVRIGQLRVPCQSPNLIESKSLKLYFNSFNQSRFATEQALKATIVRDLSQVCQADVSLELFPVNGFAVNEPADYRCLEQSVDSAHWQLSDEDYQLNHQVLNSSDIIKKQRYCSHIFRSLCPVTGQPDWASVYIDCLGRTLDSEALLRYLIAFRYHQGFHEQCVELLYQAIYQATQAQQLTVAARFLRRGGIDINPVRSSHETYPTILRQTRQ